MDDHRPTHANRLGILNIVAAPHEIEVDASATPENGTEKEARNC